MKLRLLSDLSESRAVSDLREIRSVTDVWRWLKFQLVLALTRSDPACWTARAEWAFGGMKGGPRFPSSRSGVACQQEAAKCGSCWCAKYTDAAAMERWSSALATPPHAEPEESR